MTDTEQWWTRHQAADHLGIGLHRLPQWINDGRLPRPTRRGRGGAYLWPADAVRAAYEQPQTDPDRLPLAAVAELLQISLAAAKSRRKRGRLPPPDSTGRPAWWHRSTIETYLARHTPPPAEALAGLSAVAQHLAVPRNRVTLAGLPQPDGTHHGVRWWLPASLDSIRRQVEPRPQLWTIGDITTHLKVAVDELHAAPDMPAPVATRPLRWDAAQIRSWWQTWSTTIVRDPQVLFSRDVAAATGLTYDTIRTYRAKERLPPPDGQLRGRPWWRRSTITRWNASRTPRTPKASSAKPRPSP